MISMVEIRFIRTSFDEDYHAIIRSGLANIIFKKQKNLPMILQASQRCLSGIFCSPPASLSGSGCLKFIVPFKGFFRLVLNW